jgi:hypothetical protein
MATSHSNGSPASRARYRMTKAIGPSRKRMTRALIDGIIGCCRVE